MSLPIKNFIPIHGGLGNYILEDHVPTALELLNSAFSTGYGPLNGESNILISENK